MSLEQAFRDLRHQWFMKTQFRYPKEREWESEKDDERREKENNERFRAFDLETNKIIQTEKMNEASSHPDQGISYD